MIPLSRREEQVLLSVWNLKEDAYLLSIMRHLTEITGTNWKLSAVQKPLVQLERKGYISTFMGEATFKRGGRRKKICQITPQGTEALKGLRKEQELLWASFTEKELNKVEGPSG